MFVARISRFVYDGISFEEYEFTFNFFTYRFECFQSPVGDYVCQFESYLDEEPVYFVRNGSKRKALFLMKKLLKALPRKELFSKEYHLFPCYETVLSGVRERPVGYHITTFECAKVIATEGLIPNKTYNAEVYEASRVLDQIKPKRIPEAFLRSESCYVYPVFNNDQLMLSDRSDLVLLAVSLPAAPMWVGDQGWGGFCLMYDDFSEEQRQEHIQYVRKKAGKDYWKHSMSLPEFIENQTCDYDELLITGSIPASHITPIGHWDAFGKFIEQPSFRSFVKPELQDSYQDILKQYEQ